MAQTKRGLMSDELKMQLAEELGIADIVRRDGGFQNVPSRLNGKLVKLAIERAERQMAQVTPAGQAGRG